MASFSGQIHHYLKSPYKLQRYPHKKRRKHMFYTDTFSLTFPLAVAPPEGTEIEFQVAFDIPFAIQLHPELPTEHCPNLNSPSTCLSDLKTNSFDKLKPKFLLQLLNYTLNTRFINTRHVLPLGEDQTTEGCCAAVLPKARAITLKILAPGDSRTRGGWLAFAR